MGDDFKMRAYVRQVEILTGEDPGDVRDLDHARQLHADAYDAYREEFGPFDKEATETVSMWVCNDEPYYWAARAVLRSDGLAAMAAYLTGSLVDAPKDSAAYYTVDTLSARDLRMVEWFEVADDLTSE